MKRIIVRKPGGHGALEILEEEAPSPGPGQVRVRVGASGVNYADCMVRMGYYEAVKGRYPVTPGFEFAGEVDALGEGTSGFREGERVFGITRFGGYASQIVVDADRLWGCPEGWGTEDCAGFPAVFLTAYYGLFRVARVEDGETLLVHSAAGGAGGALVQLARIAGCRVVGVVGAPDKAEYARSLGANPVIVRSAGGLWREADRAAPGGFDAIFDSGGVSTLRQGFSRLAPGGRLVSFGFADIFPRGRQSPGRLSLLRNYLRVPRFSPLEMTHTNRAVMGFNVVFLFGKLALARQAMDRMLGWIEEGKIHKPPVESFPLEKAARAHEALESGKTKGKLVLTSRVP